MSDGEWEVLQRIVRLEEQLKAIREDGRACLRKVSEVEQAIEQREKERTREGREVRRVLYSGAFVMIAALITALTVILTSAPH